MSFLAADKIDPGHISISVFKAKKIVRQSLLVHQEKSLDTLSSDEYLERTGVKLFAEDALKQLVQERPDNVVRFFERFFTSIITQTHVEGRKFEFVNSNIRNRVAFITLMEQQLINVDGNTELTVDDMHQLIAMRCQGFPRHIVAQSTAHVDVTKGPKINFKRLFTCFKTCFVYNEFLRYMHGTYGEVLQGDTKKAVDAVMSEIQSSERRRSSVIAAKFGEKILMKIQASHATNSEMFSMPPMSVLEVCVYTSVSFKQFCGAFLEHPAVEGGIYELQASYEKIAEGAFRGAKGDIQDDVEERKLSKKKRPQSKSKRQIST